MNFLSSTFRYFIRMLLLGFIFRAGVAFYIGLWSFSDFSTIQSSFSQYLYGWHFDLAVAAFGYFILFGLSVLLNLRQGSHSFVSFLLMFAYSAFIITDALYAQESGRHISYEVHNLMSISGTVPQLLTQHWKACALVLVFALFAQSFVRSRFKYNRSFIVRGIQILFIAILSVSFARGFEGIPQDPSWAYRAGGGANGAFIALNGAYGIIWAAIGEKKSNKLDVFSPSDLDTEKVFKEWKEQRTLKNAIGNFDGNIILVFLEGWPGLYIDHQENYKEVTPFFNKLKKESLSTELFLAQGKRTTEGIFATVCGVPNPLGQSIMFTEIENKSFPCLPQFLTQKGYSSAFFQGSDQYTSGVGLLVLKSGFQNSYGKNEIPGFHEKPQNGWGVYDETLYEFSIDKMKALQEPVLIGINTNTTHDSLLPDGVKPFHEGSAYFSTLHHADQELAAFYNKLLAYPWKKDWLFVLVADHTSFAVPGILSQYSLPFLMKYHKVTSSPAPMEKFFAPKVLKGAYSQNDIASTLADLTGFAIPEFSGRSLLRPDEFATGAGVYHVGQGAWFENDRVVTFNAHNDHGFACYDWKKDPQFSQSQCTTEDRKLYQRGNSFIRESQNLLFK